MVQLDGSLAGPANGLVITAGSSAIRGFAINRFAGDGSLETGNAILLSSGDTNRIEGNYLGTDVSGNSARPNDRAGILVLQSSDNLIGGQTPQTRNIISGNEYWGVSLVGPGADANQVIGNYIGVNAAGNGAVGNLVAGIGINHADDNLIGGTLANQRNVVSGNGSGIRLAEAVNNTLRGNYVGTDSAGLTALPNGIGMALLSGDPNTIGGSEPGAGNVISGNSGVGIQIADRMLGVFLNADDQYLIQGNLIGVGSDGSTPLGNGSHGILFDEYASAAIGTVEPAGVNTIAHNAGSGIAVQGTIYNDFRGNQIYSNAGLGIDFGTDGVTPNLAASDYLLNLTANYPELTRAYTGAGSTTIEGTLIVPELPVQGLVRENEIFFFANDSLDPSGHGEGATYLGSMKVSGRGKLDFSATIPIDVTPGHFITATSVRNHASSEFSAGIEVLQDADGDGVLDSVEVAGPNGGDINNDGIFDHLQSHIASLPNSMNGQYVYLEASTASLSGVRSVPNPAIGTTPPGVMFPIGFFEFTFHGPTGPSRFIRPAV